MLYNEVNQPYAYIYPSSLKTPSHSNPILSLYITPEHQADLPVLYNMFPLAIYFTHGGVYMCIYIYIYIYISIPISKFVPLSPANLSVSICPFSTSVSYPASELGN